MAEQYDVYRIFHKNDKLEDIYQKHGNSVVFKQALKRALEEEHPYEALEFFTNHAHYKTVSEIENFLSMFNYRFSYSDNIDENNLLTRDCVRFEDKDVVYKYFSLHFKNQGLIDKVYEEYFLPNLLKGNYTEFINNNYDFYRHNVEYFQEKIFSDPRIDLNKLYIALLNYYVDHGYNNLYNYEKTLKSLSTLRTDGKEIYSDPNFKKVAAKYLAKTGTYKYKDCLDIFKINFREVVEFVDFEELSEYYIDDLMIEYVNKFDFSNEFTSGRSNKIDVVLGRIDKFKKYIDKDFYEKLFVSLTESKRYSIDFSNLPINYITPVMYKTLVNEVTYNNYYFMRNKNSMSNEERVEYEEFLNQFTPAEIEQYTFMDTRAYVKNESPGGSHSIIPYDLDLSKLDLESMKECNADSFFIRRYIIPTADNKYTFDLSEFIIDHINKHRDIVSYGTYDILSRMPEELITEELLIKCCECSPYYLNKVDIYSPEGIKFLNATFHRELSDEQVEALRYFRKNNAHVFDEFNIDLLNPNVLKHLDYNALEFISRYPNLQRSVINLSNKENELSIFGKLFDKYKGEDRVYGPLLDMLVESLAYNKENLARSLVEDQEFLDEHLDVAFFLITHYVYGFNVKTNDDFKFFVNNFANVNKMVINTPTTALVETKNALLQLRYGLTYEDAKELLTVYGNDSDTFLYELMNKDQSQVDRNQLAALRTLNEIKKIMSNNNIDELTNIDVDSIIPDFSQLYFLEKNLKTLYGKDFSKKLNYIVDSTSSLSKNIDGEDLTYTVNEVSDSFSFFVHMMDAYGKSKDKSEDFYAKWNTTEMSSSHGLCTSFVNEMNPGTAMTIDKKQNIILGFNNISNESIIAMSPYDLCSFNQVVTSQFLQQRRFFRPDQLLDNTRGRYSEVVLEIQDYNYEEYRKIQPDFIVCFEEVDDNSIKAAHSLSKNLGRDIPIVLIDRRKIAAKRNAEIEELHEKFSKSHELYDLAKLINIFESSRNAYRDSTINQELVGEGEVENINAPFNRKKLNAYINEAMDYIEEHINDEGIENYFNRFKSVINEEMTKYYRAFDISIKQIYSGIDVSTFMRINQIQERLRGRVVGKATVESYLDKVDTEDNIVMKHFEGASIVVDPMYRANQVNEMVDREEIDRVVSSMAEKGYYSGNRVNLDHLYKKVLFASLIAKQSNISDPLLMDIVTYYESGIFKDMNEDNLRLSIENYISDNPDVSDEDKKIVVTAMEYLSNNGFNKVNDSLLPDSLTVEEKKRLHTIIDVVSDSYKLTKCDNIVIRGITQFESSAELNSRDSLSLDASKNLMAYAYGLSEAMAKDQVSEIMELVGNITNFDEKVKDYYTSSTLRNSELLQYDICKLRYLINQYPEILRLNRNMVYTRVNSNEELISELNTQDISYDDSIIVEESIKRVV